MGAGSNLWVDHAHGGVYGHGFTTFGPDLERVPPRLMLPSYPSAPIRRLRTCIREKRLRPVIGQRRTGDLSRLPIWESGKAFNFRRLPGQVKCSWESGHLHAGPTSKGIVHD